LDAVTTRVPANLELGVLQEPDLVIDLRDPGPPSTKAPRRTAFVLLLALNGLNLLDAILTFVVTRVGVAREGNPIVDAMTLPGKVAFVAALSFLLWKLRPGALIVPVVAYALVVCYTVAGALFLP
jgi:hypothetical protein